MDRKRLLKLTPEQARSCIKKRSKINEAGCWIWQRALVHGYGVINIDFRNMQAHVMSYKAFINKQIPVGFDVHHKCEVPSCVNPKHLQAISHGENVSIGSRKGKRIKLSLDQVKEIRRLLRCFPKPTYQALAEQFKVSGRLIQHINDKTAWKDYREIECQKSI